jgi:hypothetical protein
MTRMKAVDVALVLERMKPSFPEETRLLQSHIEELSTEEAWTALVREVVEGMSASRNAEERTAENLLSLKPLMERTTEALERMAEQERRRNDLEERRVKLDEAREQRAAEMNMARLKGVVIPALTAFLGALGTAVTFYFGGNGG